MKKLALFNSVAALALLAGIPATVHADRNDRLYDFTDAYYRQNGVNPALIVGRRNGTDGRSVFDTPFFSYQRNVRAILTLPAYGQSGNATFWTVMGDLFATSFTNDAAGQRAKQIADGSILYVFPRRDQADPVTLGANRQADIVDLRNGYFSNNPLGLWLHTWVSYTDRAFNTADGRKMLADLTRKNGTALDGTPIIRSISEIDGLVSKGFAAKRLRNPSGSEGPMYGICPVIEDPRGGGIAPDAFLAFVRKADGTPLEPDFVRFFTSLQTTGEFPRN